MGALTTWMPAVADVGAWTGPVIAVGTVIAGLLVLMVLVTTVRAFAEMWGRPQEARWRPPDWYPRPDGTEQYWDGTAWTRSRPHRTLVTRK